MESLLQIILHRFSTQDLIRLCEEENVHCEFALMLKYEELYGIRKLYPHLSWKQNLLNITVWVFGENTFGQLGLGDSPDNTNTPTPIEEVDLPPIRQISAGGFHSLLLDGIGQVWEFGKSKFGQLRLRDFLRRNIPTLIEGLPPIIEISAGFKHSLLLDEKGQVWSFGGNGAGQLGLGDNDNRDMPTLIEAEYLPPIRQISAGGFHSLLLDVDGEVWAFGNNELGQLGLSHSANENVPTLIETEDLPPITEISAGFNHSLLLDYIGRVWAFGDNIHSQSGLDFTLATFIPTLIETEDLPPIRQISAGKRHNLLLDVYGRVWAFGDNEKGQLGLDDLPVISVPTLIKTKYLPPIIKISAGGNHSLLLDVGNQVWTFGYNRFGQLGLMDNDNRDIPILIEDLKAVEISAGDQHSLLIGF